MFKVPKLKTGLLWLFAIAIIITIGSVIYFTLSIDTYPQIQKILHATLLLILFFLILLITLFSFFTLVKSMFELLKKKIWPNVTIFIESIFELLKERIWWIIAVIFTAGFLGYSMFSVDTYMQIDLTASDISFQVAENTIELNSLPFQSITINRFSKATLVPTDLEVEDSNSEWKTDVLDHLQMEIQAEERESALILESEIMKPTKLGILKELSLIKDTHVKLAIIDDKEKKLLIKVNYPQPTLQDNSLMIRLMKVNSYQNPLFLNTESCQSNINIEKNGTNDFIRRFKIKALSQRNPYIDIIGFQNSNRTQELKLTLGMVSKKPMNIFSSAIPLANNFKFSQLVEENQRISSLIGQVKISYPKYPDINPIVFDNSNFIISGNNQFHMKEVIFDPENPKGIKLRLYGDVKERMVVCPEMLGKRCADENYWQELRDYRLIRYDTMKNQKWFLVLFNISTWLIPILVGILVMIRVKISEIDKELKEILEKNKN